MTAFRACYADLKIIKSRSVAQVILEIPLEQADAALLVLGGVPRPDSEVWVGVARLAKDAPVASPEAVEQPKERKRFEEMRPSAQAALLCDDQRFQAWIGSRAPRRWAGLIDAMAPYKEAARVLLCEEVGITSRKQLDVDGPFNEMFHALVASYRREMGMETWRP